jgi:hypothetical protein
VPLDRGTGFGSDLAGSIRAAIVDDEHGNGTHAVDPAPNPFDHIADRPLFVESRNHDEQLGLSGFGLGTFDERVHGRAV